MRNLDPEFVSRIFEETSHFYRRTKAIYAQTGYEKEYPLNFFWGGDNMRQLTDIIRRSNTVEEKIAAIHDTFMFSVNTDDDGTKNRMIDWYIDYFHSIGVKLDDLDLAIQESPLSNPRNAVRRGGRLLAPDFLRTVILALEIQKHCRFNAQRFNVLELGAGYGGLARTLRLFWPGISQVIIDIPETLFFSSIFLRLNFPQAKVCFVTDPADLRESVSEYDFIFIPTKFAYVLKGTPFELFCNTASLGEMKNSVIRHWLDFVQNQVEVRYFFGLNRFLNTVDPKRHAWRLDENVCSVSFDARWRVLQWELEPTFSRCPYLETIVTRNLEIIAERRPANEVNSAYHQHLSQQVAESLRTQDWFIHAREDNAMLLRDNFLAHDLTRRGVLFKLWESIRLCPRVENLVMMLTYLKALERGKPFEEYFYYTNLLRELLQNTPEAEVTPEVRARAQELLGVAGATSQVKILDSPVPCLVESDFQGFNLVHYRSQFYALAQNLGPFDLTQASKETLKALELEGRCLIGDSLDNLKQGIGNLRPFSLEALLAQAGRFAQSNGHQFAAPDLYPQPEEPFVA
jgi:hypothetical protein